MIKGQALQTIYMHVDRQTDHPNSYTRSAGENYSTLGEKRIQPVAWRSHNPHKNQPTGIFRQIAKDQYLYGKMKGICALC